MRIKLIILTVLITLGLIFSRTYSSQNLDLLSHSRNDLIHRNFLKEISEKTGIDWTILHLSPEYCISYLGRVYPKHPFKENFPVEKESAVEIAMGFLSQIKEFLGISDLHQLKLELFHTSYFDKPFGEERDYTLVFNQQILGIPILDARILVAMTEYGDIYAVKSYIYKEIAEPLQPILNADSAINFAQAYYQTIELPFSEPSIFYHPRFAAFVWRVEFPAPIFKTAFVDAITGEVLDETINIVYSPVSDVNVCGKMVDMFGAPLQYAKIFFFNENNQSLGITYTNADGNYTFHWDEVEASNKMSVEAFLNGQICQVYDFYTDGFSRMISDRTNHWVPESGGRYTYNFIFDNQFSYTTDDDLDEGGTVYREQYWAYFWLRDNVNHRNPLVTSIVNYPLGGAAGASSGSLIYYADGYTLMNNLPNPYEDIKGEVVLHEYGHSTQYFACGGYFIGNACRGKPGSAPECNDGNGCNRSQDCQNHGNTASKCSCDGLAEGWADFFAVALHNSINPNDHYFDFYPHGRSDLETNIGWWGYNFPIRHETVIRNYLWDLYDPVDENDKDIVELGFKNIFSTLKALKATTFEEFYEDLCIRYPANYRGYNYLLEARGFNYTLKNASTYEFDGDNDGIYEAGETIAVVLTLENRFMGQPMDLQASLTLDETYIQMLKGRSKFGNVQQDDTNEFATISNSLDPFLIKVKPGTPPATLVSAQANLVGGHQNRDPYQFTFRLEALNIETGLTLKGSPLVLDLNNDGKKEILVAADTAIKAYSLNGANLPNWNKTVDSRVESSPSAGDVNNDGTIDVVITSSNGYVYLWSGNGDLFPFWPIKLPRMIRASATISDLDNDGDKEIIVPCYDNKIYVFHHNGTNLTGWPVNTGGEIYTTVAVGDVDNDGIKELVFISNKSGAGESGYLQILKANGQSMSGFPIRLPTYGFSPPALGDLDNDGDLEIVFGIGPLSGSTAPESAVLAYHHNGQPVNGWPFEDLQKSVACAVALGDVDGDGYLEVAFSSNDQNAYLLNHDGTLVSGWPYLLGNNSVASPVIGDLDNDGENEVLVGSNGHLLFAFKADGSLLPNYPKDLDYALINSPAIGDFDEDGILEILAANDHGGMFMWKQSAFNPSKLEWWSYHHDNARTGLFYKNHPPSILLGGYWDTRMTSGGGGILRIIAVVNDAEGIEDVLRVELSYQGIPTGILLKDDGASGDFGINDTIFGFQVYVPGGAAPSLRQILEIICRDEEGAKGNLFPYLTVK